MASPTIVLAPSRSVTATVQPVVFRVALYSVGTVLLASGVALTLVAGLGVGPSDVFIGAVARHLGVGHGTATSAFIGAMVLVGVLLGSRPGPGTFITAVAIGPIIDRAEHMLAPVHTGITFIDAGTGLFGVAMICVGVGLVICADVGRGATELLVDRVASHLRRRPSFVRTAIEVTMLVSGLLLAGPAGPITVAVAVGIGPGIVASVRYLDRVLSADVSVVTIRRLTSRPRISRLH